MNAHLAPQRGIDLGHESGRHLNQLHAPLERGGGETDEVTDHTAAEGHHRVRATDMAIVQHAVELLGAAEVLLAFSRRDDDLRDGEAGFPQATASHRHVVRRHVFVAAHDHLAARAAPPPCTAELGQDAATDQHLVVCVTASALSVVARASRLPGLG